jgi:glycosyltransferase involved in cell wall biosynthesis
MALSVVIPAFDEAARLGRTLAAVTAYLAPRAAATEIIVVDDGSRDRTAQVAAAFAGVRVLRRAPAGVAAARNAGIAAGGGDWIAPLDADDLWHPRKLELQVEAALAAPRRPGFVYCWLRVIDGDGRVRGSGARNAFDGCIIHRHLYRNVAGSGSQLLIARDAFEAAGGYDERLVRCEDFLLQLLLASRHPVAVVPQFLVGYRVHAGQMSADRRAMLQGWRQVRAQLRAHCPGVQHGYDRWMDARQRYHAAFAERRAGRPAAAARRLLQALAGDPAWMLATLARAAGAHLRRAVPSQALEFHALDPLAVPADDEPHPIDAWLRRLDARRLAQLARLDAAYAASR